jgi:Ca2+-binding EF-hand superfamily protein
MNTRLLLLPLPILAATLLLRAAGPLDEKFKEFDKNNDGVLSGDELDAASYLRRLDLDGDGKVTLAEANEAVGKAGRKVVQALRERGASRAGALPGPRTADVFAELDKNRDGKLTPDELKDSEWFRKLDTNGDGAVTLQESLAVVGERLPQKYLPGFDAPPIKPAVELQEGPLPVRAAERGVGRMVPDVALKGLDGDEWKLRPATRTGGAMVVGFFSATCPISGKLGPEMARLEKDYRDKGVVFTWLGAPPSSSVDEIKHFVSTHGLEARIARDADGAVARALGAETTTEVFVVDAARTLVYRGAINDQYGLGYALDAPRHGYLRDALDAVLVGEAPALAATTAPGCALDLPKQNPVAPAPATYHRDIARLMNQNCVECHRAGGLAPFSLTSYDGVIEHAGMIRKQIDRGVMPPWFASSAQSGAHAIFSNDRSLSEADKGVLLGWLNSDRPKGDIADAPLPRKFPEGWAIGKPDLVVQLPRPVAIKAEGTMPYQNVTVPVSLTEDRWVQAYEIAPTDRTVVHHVIVRIVEKGGRAARRDGDNETDGLWAAYVPGNNTRILPDGYAKLLPAGASMHFQIHYTPNGKASEDQLKIGLKFAAKPPQYIVQVAGVANPGIKIPPNDPNHVETFTRLLPTDMLVSAFMPHMHVRGKSFKYEVTTPDGKTETLLDVPRYDFNWQLQYRLAQPKVLPRGSTLKITAVFDNSSNNKANPDPGKTVRWGQQTYDEMMIGYVEHFVLNKDAHMAAK